VIRVSNFQGSKRLRDLRFWMLEKLVVPLAIVPFRLLVWTWRRRELPEATVREIARQPRVIIVVCHGELPPSLAWAKMWEPFGRRWLGLLTPSLDGRLMAATLRHFGVDSVALPRGTRGVEGAQEFIRRVQAGAIGVLAVDGPRGPRGVVKDGVVRTAFAANAAIVVARTAASHGITFKSWDRARLPLPFARVEAELRLLPPKDPGAAYTVQEIQQAFLPAGGLAESPR
jgi:lysophospholipid acyltransferase (LPLAT)-like uncharacterized protein